MGKARGSVCQGGDLTQRFHSTARILLLVGSRVGVWEGERERGRQEGWTREKEGEGLRVRWWMFPCRCRALCGLLCVL